MAKRGVLLLTEPIAFEFDGAVMHGTLVSGRRRQRFAMSIADSVTTHHAAAEAIKAWSRKATAPTAIRRRD